MVPVGDMVVFLTGAIFFSLMMTVSASVTGSIFAAFSWAMLKSSMISVISARRLS